MLPIRALERGLARRVLNLRKNQILHLTWVLVVLMLGTGLALAPQPSAPAHVFPAAAVQSSRDITPDETSVSFPFAVMLRRVYRYSVIPGGVEDPEELRAAMARDTVVARHYERVRLTNLEEAVVHRSKFAYVSYRMRERVYWTRRPVLLRIGERLLTDGHTIIRARCGNQVAFTPRLPVAPVDPSDLDIVGELIPPPERKIPAGLVIPPPLRKRFVPIPPIFPPPGGGHPPPRINAGDPKLGVPWPPVAAGIAGIFFFRSRLSRRTSRTLPPPA